MSELKPCPFCGTSVVGIEHDGLYRWVECGNMDCNAAGKVFTFLIDVDADHIVANNWNTRPIEDELRAELARRDEIITRLKEDGERLANIDPDVFCCQPHEHFVCSMSRDDVHEEDCPMVLHRELIEELNQTGELK